MLVAIRWYLPDNIETTTRSVDSGTEGESVTNPSTAGRGSPRVSTPRLRTPSKPRQPKLGVRLPSASKSTAQRAARAASGAEPSSPEQDQTAVPQDPALSTSTEEVAPTSPTVFSIQVGAYTSETNIGAVLRDLEDRGYQPYVVRVTQPDQQVFFTIRIGRFTTWDEANLAAAEFHRREGKPAVVRPPNPSQ
jgi:cell division septation protein DedD